jgi:UDP-N-acetyl-D-glucosamine dehydrogenase
MPYFVFDQIAAGLNEHSKSIKGSNILVLGLAYKRDVDDLRESPSLTILELLRHRGATVAYNDPYFPNSRPRAPLRPEHDQHSAG